LEVPLLSRLFAVALLVPALAEVKIEINVEAVRGRN
jgi:hypothetical protein